MKNLSVPVIDIDKIDIDSLERKLEAGIQAGRERIESTIVSIDWGVVD